MDDDLFNCTMCGACCINTEQNKSEGYPWYVEIDDPESEILRRKDWVKKFLVHDPDGVPHMKLHPDGRCTALKGRLGQRVHCEVYKFRPRCCSVIFPGDKNCLKAREAHGITSM